MKVLKGKPVSDAILQEIGARMEAVRGMLGRAPRLALLSCGEDAAYQTYVRNAMKKAAVCGIEAVPYEFPADVNDAVFMHTFQELNGSRAVDGLLLPKMLPQQLNDGFVRSCLDSGKDVDGTSPVNAAGIYVGEGGSLEADSFAPCAAQAVIELLHYYKIPLAGKHVVVIGRSQSVGRPLAMLLLQEDATVTICHSHTADLEKVCHKADVLISAVGSPQFVTERFLRRGAVVVDVGVNVNEEGKLCGDVDFASCSKKAKAITPVPGGIGTVTTAVLMKHVMQAASRDLL